MVILFVCQIDKTYNQIYENEQTLSDIEKLITEDEIKKHDQDENAISLEIRWLWQQQKKRPYVRESASCIAKINVQSYGLSQAACPSVDPAHQHDD